MLNFEKLILHNFGSYKHAEVDLQNRGFCLVSGRNNYKKDNATSNGSGKSFLWSAICFALCGETISGLHTNLKNINVTDDITCFVTLQFSEDNDHYIITRHVTPKSDLKIWKNDIDVSGKGIRESEKKLAELLPDLTKNLIASTIIIGQGMPNKFSSFSPSGRKDLLEKLTRADFMIEDIKQRVNTRLDDLTSQLRVLEDLNLSRKSQITVYESTRKTKLYELDHFVKPDFEAQIAEATAQVTSYTTEIEQLTTTISKHEQDLSTVSTELYRINAEKSKELDALKLDFDKITYEVIQQRAALQAKSNSIASQIKQLKAVKDTCPMCHQKLPGAHVHDTSDLEMQLAATATNLELVERDLTSHNATYQTQFTAISSKYEHQFADSQNASNFLREQLTACKNALRLAEQKKIASQQSIAKAQYECETWAARYAALQQEVNSIQETLAKLASEQSEAEAQANVLNEHLKVVKRMDSLIKRDFRGYLLSNIIAYLNKKAKEYCNIVFGTTDLEVALDDNALNISYCGKMFDNLSGGEKQRVDLILQFAIRNMLTVYLNFNSNILVLDEITDFLDKKSCAAVLNLITQELNTIESVFVISHHASALALPIDSEMVIEKNELGISEIIAGV